MDERELLRLWEKTIPGGDLTALPVNVTYRPPERLEAPPPLLAQEPGAERDASEDARAVAAAPTVPGEPDPRDSQAPPPSSVGAQTIASTGGLSRAEAPTPPPPSSSFDRTLPGEGKPLPEPLQPQALPGEGKPLPEPLRPQALPGSGVGFSSSTSGTVPASSSVGAETVASGSGRPRPDTGGGAPPPGSDAGSLAAQTMPSTGGTPSSSSATVPASSSGGAGGAPSRDGAQARSLATSTRFDLMNELGRGGMGVVYRARQRSLEREIALKRLIPGKAGPAERQQFLAEALVTGVLDHPNIVSVHDLGRTSDGDIFLAMKLVNGVSWHDLLHPRKESEKAEPSAGGDRGGVSPPRATAAKLDQDAHIRILLEVGNAVAFAHSKGIVHRDLKPANVMVGDFGEVLVMDWGIAVDVRDRPAPETARVPHRTSVTTPAGTPCYMAPELAVGRGAQIGPATDIFLLGAILHEIVTGAPPHAGDSLIVVLRAAMECAPKTYGPGVPQALQDVLRRSMAKDPKERYPDVKALRAALEHYLAHRQSVKISDAAAATLAKAMGQEPASPAALAAEAAGRERKDRHRAKAEERVLRNRRYGAFAEAVAGFAQALLLWPENDAAKQGERRARVAFASAALAAGDLGLAEAQTSALPQGQEDRRRLEAEIADIEKGKARAERTARRVSLALRAAVAIIVLGLLAGFLVVRNEQQRVAAERDRAKQAEATASSERDRARLEAWNGRLEMAHSFYERAMGLASQKKYQSAEACLLRALEIAPRGEAPALLRPSWDAPGWPAEAWRLHRAYFALCPREKLAFAAPPATTFTAAAVGPSGTAAILGDALGSVHVFDLASGTLTAVIPSSVRSPVSALALSSDQKRAAAVTSYGALRVLDLEAGREAATLTGPQYGFVCAAIGPQGRRVFAGGSDRKAWLFEVASGKVLWSFDTDDGGPPRTPASCCFSPDGKLGLMGLWDGTARLYDMASGTQLGILGGAMHWVSAVAFEPDGKSVWLGSNDGLLRRIDLASGKETRRIQTDDVEAIAISPDAKSALVRLRSGGIEVHALDRGEKSSEIEATGNAPLVAAPSADGNTAVVAFREGPPRAFDLSRALRRPRRLAEVGSREDAIGAVAVSLDRKRFLVASVTGTATLFELRGRKELRRIATGAQGTRAVALSGDTRSALLGAADGTVRFLDLEAGGEARPLAAGVGPVHSVDLADDGRVALAAGGDAVLVFDARTGAERVRRAAPEGGGFVHARLGVSATAVVASAGTRALLYSIAGEDARSAARPPRAFDAGARVNAADVSADGVLVAAACEDGAIRVWEVASGALVRRIVAHTDAVTDLAFLADGRTTVSGSRDQTIAVTDVANGAVVRRLRIREGSVAPPASQGGGAVKEGGLAAIAVSRDGGLALSTTLEGAALIWPLLDASVPLEPPADLSSVYEVTGLRVVAEGEARGAIEPVRREGGR